MSEDYQPALYWDSAYAIAITLIENHPTIDPVHIGLYELADMVEALPGFSDDPALANDRILLDIMNCWYEEMTNV